jgi:glycosyltransferase involved in cell wall biosynthesis
LKRLEIAVRSVLNQTLLPAEILIGDDSRDQGDAVERFLSELKSPVPIRYFRRSQRMGQAKNVDMLFEEVESDLIVLLHDDDYLLPNALEDFFNSFQKHPEIVCAFGYHRYVDAQGKEMTLEQNRAANEEFLRTPAHEGLIRDVVKAAMFCQLPGDIYMVPATVAKQVGYDRNGEAGDACDVLFGLKLAELKRPFYFIPKEVGVYALSPDSVLRGGMNNSGYHSFRLLLAHMNPERSQDPELVSLLKRRVKNAIGQAPFCGQRTQGWKWFFGDYFRDSILTSSGVMLFAKLILPVSVSHFIMRQNRKRRSRVHAGQVYRGHD